MKAHVIAVLITVLLAVAAVAGDYFLKLASSHKSPFTSWQFGVGMLIYGLSAVGLVCVMPHLNLAHLGAWYCVTMVLCLAILGTTVFGESLNLREWVGVGLAVVSLVLLSRLS